MSFGRLLLPLILLLATSGSALAQHTFTAIVKDEHEDEALVGASVHIEGTVLGAATDETGRIRIEGIPEGEHVLVFSMVGYATHRQAFAFPLAGSTPVIELEPVHEELEEVAVTATRTSRTISDVPTRVETIAGEEIDEKISMEPGNISMLLNESPGITVQQTSPTSGNAAIRIQGLDGRYTQILKDGFPLYGGFSGGLSLLQIPPLDLAQVEVIKGPVSTLYGGDAIAGLVNLVSKAPTGEPERTVIANATSAGGYDLGGFFSARGKRLGFTALVSGNVQQAYDADEDGFTNLPETQRISVNPRLYYYPGQTTTLMLGLSGMRENREGGALDEGGFFEHHQSWRLTSQARLDQRIGEAGLLTAKNSVSAFQRGIRIPDYRFNGRQLVSYSEVSYFLSGEKHDLVVGADIRTDTFRETDEGEHETRDYSYRSAGLFLQDTYDLGRHLTAEAGARVEMHNHFGSFFLPRASLLVRLTEGLSARLGGGLGYKAPSIFMESSEQVAFRNVRPLDSSIKAETSRGGSVDINYQTLLFDHVGFSLNQAFYFTDLLDPLIASIDDSEMLVFRNAPGRIETRALETNMKLSLGDLKLFLGYVYLDAREKYEQNNRLLPLTPASKTYSVLVYEKHGLARIGLEAYYTGEQKLNDGQSTSGYWVAGVMAERRFGPARLFVNFENVLDTKQSNYAPVVLGSPVSPQFAEIWAPMDGFIINGGVKLNL